MCCSAWRSFETSKNTDYRGKVHAAAAKPTRNHQTRIMRIHVHVRMPFLHPGFLDSPQFPILCLLSN